MAEKEVEDCIDGELSAPAVMMENLLTVDKVSKHFVSDSGRVPVLTDVSLTVRDIKYKPQILSILGPSGAGKTTLLRIIAGLDQPDSGQVLCDEQGGMRPVQIGDVGVVFQRYPLFDDRTVLQNLVEPARNSRLSKSEAEEKALQYLADFGLSKQAKNFPMQLSGGQRQRVAIAQQLIQNRFYIIYDEPFSGLDPNNINRVIRLLSRVAGQHTKNTFIIVTHDITSALIISDRVYLLGKPTDAPDTEGARIVKEYDLIAEDLAYHEDVEDSPRFLEIRKEIKYSEFPKLETKVII
ncbi:MAG: ATP-binding cassette domain-containing protein [Pyrinomonadaceae bacterium]